MNIVCLLLKYLFLFRMALLLPLIFLLKIQCVYSDDGWGVNYNSSSICALKGSTVIINCTYEYPSGHQIMKVFWTNTDFRQPNEEHPDLFNDSEYRQRIKYLGDKHHDCTMRLTDVRQTDSHKYYFRFITDKDRWLGVPGVSLDITDLQVESSGERVTEGHSVTLTCKSRCSLTDRSTFIWFKNTQSLSERTDRNNQLILQSVRREDAGNYSCAVQGHKLTSPHQYLNVIYAPDNPVISINPSGEIMEGDSVTLTCSSDANPPVHNYTWFKANEISSVGSGKNYTISKIRSDHSGEYMCKSRNELGEKNSSVTLNVLYPPKNVTVSISKSGKIKEGDSVTLTCSSDANPPAEIKWFKETQYIESGKNYIILNISSDHSGEYKCKSRNKHGEKDSDTVILNVLYYPKKVIASISGSGEIMEGDSVNLTCSSESNPPVQNYSWFKVNKTSSVGSGQMYSITNINSSHSEWFYCEAQNEVGSRRSNAVLMTVNHRFDYNLLFGIMAACGGLFIMAMIILIFFIMRKRRVAKTKDAHVSQLNLQDNLYCNVSESAHHDDVQHGSAVPKELKAHQTSAGEAPESSYSEEIQYATFHHHTNKEMKNSEEFENPYCNIKNSQPDAAVRSDLENTSVIYSSVK
ncbi:B-cell receptor CD22-like [Paramisgurnus dabryanus]|uniref:B-cell receptor CD22-like n=1 Tax=Paramisgurnus dabryanus TaxID=90735 RepID=UPI003CCFC5E3